MTGSGAHPSRAFCGGVGILTSSESHRKSKYPALSFEKRERQGRGTQHVKDGKLLFFFLLPLRPAFLDDLLRSSQCK